LKRKKKDLRGTTLLLCAEKKEKREREGAGGHCGCHPKGKKGPEERIGKEKGKT